MPRAQRSLTRYSVRDGSTEIVDDYGFYITKEEQQANDAYSSLQKAKKGRRKKSLAARRRWQVILSPAACISGLDVKTDCRRGIPAEIRGDAWLFLLRTKTAVLNPENAGTYAVLLQQKLNGDLESVIERDLPRTFPTHMLFSEHNGESQQKLRNVLHAYAVSNPTVGYVQGMGFVAATLLTQIVDEECTFWALKAMMEDPRYRMQELYMPGFPLLHLCHYWLEKLIKRFRRSLYNQLKKYSVDPSFFASHWFLTLFSYHINFAVLLRLWDMFLYEGWKVILRFGIAILLLQEDLTQSNDETTLLVKLKELNTKNVTTEPEAVLRYALKNVKFKTAKLRAWEAEFRAKAQGVK